MTPVRIDYYSDVLCIWAFIAQPRMAELQNEFGDKVDIRWRYVPVFGDVNGRLDAQWRDRGGLGGYADHVHRTARQFPEIEIGEAAWRSGAPHSSAPAHLWLCAARLLSRQDEEQLARAIREAFFCRGQDIGQADTLRTIAEDAGLDADALEAHTRSGAAWAALSSDMLQARDEHVQASPTLIFNEGRQRLTGNVGYRIIKANLTELIDRPTPQYSWC